MFADSSFPMFPGSFLLMFPDSSFPMFPGSSLLILSEVIWVSIFSISPEFLSADQLTMIFLFQSFPSLLGFVSEFR